jgi:hypothetical protein
MKQSSVEGNLILAFYFTISFSLTFMFLPSDCLQFLSFPLIYFSSLSSPPLISSVHLISIPGYELLEGNMSEYEKTGRYSPQGGGVRRKKGELYAFTPANALGPYLSGLSKLDQVSHCH